MNQSNFLIDNLLHFRKFGHSEERFIILVNDCFFPVSSLESFAKNLSFTYTILYIEFKNDFVFSAKNRVFSTFTDFVYSIFSQYPKATTIVSVGYASSLVLELIQGKNQINNVLCIDPKLNSIISKEESLENFAKWWMKNVTPLDALFKIPEMADFWENFQNRTSILEQQESIILPKLLFTQSMVKNIPYLANTLISKFPCIRVDESNSNKFFNNKNNIEFLDFLIKKDLQIN